MGRFSVEEGAAADVGAQVYDAQGALSECSHCGLGCAPACNLASVYVRLDREQRIKLHHPRSILCVPANVNSEPYTTFIETPEKLQAKCAVIR